MRGSSFAGAAAVSVMLLALAGAAPAADTPAAAVVRHFLEARAAGRSADAYKLLVFLPGSNLTEKEYAAGIPPVGEAKTQIGASLFGLAMLFFDTHNTQKYTFTVLGPDPADPAAVLVRAAPPAGAVDAPAVTLRVFTTRVAGGALRVDDPESMSRATPQETGLSGPAARRVRVQGNLKQLALAITLYAQDHEVRLPDADKWVDEVLPYVKDRALFRDPLAPVRTYGFAFNRALSRKSLAVIESPATTVLLFESTKGVKNASDLGKSIPHPGRDSGGTDYAFADGHVKWFRDGTKPSFKLTGK